METLGLQLQMYGKGHSFQGYRGPPCAPNIFFLPLHVLFCSQDALTAGP